MVMENDGSSSLRKTPTVELIMPAPIRTTSGSVLMLTSPSFVKMYADLVLCPALTAFAAEWFQGWRQGSLGVRRKLPASGHAESPRAELGLNGSAVPVG